jgi:hypothetical protein
MGKKTKVDYLKARNEAPGKECKQLHKCEKISV